MARPTNTSATYRGKAIDTFLSKQQFEAKLRILQWDCTYGPMVILGGGRFLMSEVPLYLQENGVGAFSDTKKRINIR